MIGSTTRQGTRTGWAGSSAFSTSASATGWGHPVGRGPVRCDQHLSTLLILADEDLAAALRIRTLAGRRGG